MIKDFTINDSFEMMSKRNLITLQPSIKKCSRAQI